MIQKILNKCLEELNSEKPDLSYIRGMIEVLLASQDAPVVLAKSFVGAAPVAAGEKPKDEAAMLDAKARAAVEHVKTLNSEPQ